MAKKRILHKYTWKGQEYETTLGAASKIVNKSVTFLQNRLNKDGMSFNDAVNAVPGDPKYRKVRRKPVNPVTTANKLGKKQERYAKENKDLINKFFSRGLNNGIS